MSVPLVLSPWLQTSISTFMTTLTGLAFETIPFLLLGTILSSFIHVFVSDRLIRRVFPENPYLSILVAVFIGAVVPICECGTVPIARRLREKGLPLSTATAFLLAAPLANPMTIVSTYVAFKGGPYPVYLYRLGFGLCAAFLLALFVESSEAGRRRDREEAPAIRFRHPSSQVPARGRFIRAPKRVAKRPTKAALVAAMLEHASGEFFDSARYLIAGISAAALLRAIVPGALLSAALAHPALAIAAGLLLAYVMSLCSSADAFVARSLFAPGSYPAAIAFLVFGPMIDLKNTILLSRFVPARRLATLVALAAATSGLAALLAAPALGGLH
jgi:uncharacterized membrane protein YraQ (UPF0718 family)